MSFAECSEVLSTIESEYKERWEHTRMQMYAIAQANCSEELSPFDIFEFDWDNKDDEDNEEDIENLRERASLIKV